jgi:hypothetical protein
MVQTKLLAVVEQLHLPDDLIDALIDQYVQQDPNRRGRHEARVVTEIASPQIWILIPYLRAARVEEIAEAYNLPMEAVLAAIGYDRRLPDLFDARILLERETSAA